MKKILLFAKLLVGSLSLLAGLDNRAGTFPAISDMSHRDEVFKQYAESVESSYRLVADFQRTGAGREGLADSLSIYTYTLKKDDDIFQIYSRCNISLAAVATLNRINHPGDLHPQDTVLLPSIPGVFVPVKPYTALEQIMGASREAGILIAVPRNGESVEYRFFPGEVFTKTELAYFYNTGFVSPLKAYRVTSDFGERIDPITNRPSFHRGCDLAAPMGTEVYAAKEGTVIEQGQDSVYGNYIIIQHSDGWVSLYGHLSKIQTTLRSAVRSGAVIGRVGSTGLSTGPHLHFELRQNGKYQDPGKYLFRDGTS
jgi:murein DD-endopeptidase MepM/ murein hydrolase activator NlpD